MSGETRLERALPGILADLGESGTPDYTDLLLARTARTRQRPAWSFPERWLPMDISTSRARPTVIRLRTAGMALLVLAVLIAIALALALVAGSSRRLPAPFGPAANGAILYSANGDILAGDPLSGAARVVVPGSDFDFGPGYSPDGSQMVFLRRVDPTKDGATDLVVARSDGSGARVVTAKPLTEIPEWYVWAPDGRSILLITTPRGDGVMEIIDTVTVGQPRIVGTGTVVPDLVQFRPPDGRQILFVGRDGPNLGLYTMNIDGTDLTPVVKPFMSDDPDHELKAAQWSPDGTRIVYQRRAGVDASMRLFVANADGSDPHQVGYRPGDILDAWAAWSPDGKRIVYQHALDDTYRYVYQVVNLADDSIVTTGPILDVDSNAGFSPDGKHLLFIPPAGGPAPLMLLDPDGGPPATTQLISDGGDWQRIAP